MAGRGRDGSLAGGNAGDPEQVRKKGDLVKYARLRYLTGLRSSLQTAEQREMWWELLGRCHIFSTIRADSPWIFENAGRHDFGLELMNDLIEASEGSYLLMQKEAMERDRRHTEPAAKPVDEGTTDG